jgi:hypothetical protein
MCVEVGPVERLLGLIPVNTPREGVVTPLGRYFDVHGRARPRGEARPYRDHPPPQLGTAGRMGGRQRSRGSPVTSRSGEPSKQS